MNIQYYGDYCFKITTKPGGRATEDVIIWTDPFDSSIGLRSPQGQADIIFISHTDKIDAQASSLRGDSIAINTPGEYAAKDINVFGIPAFRDNENGAKLGQNTVFVFQAESINMCFLGALGHELSSQQIEKIGTVDILFAPIGGKDTASIKIIDDTIKKIEPAIVIPMHYHIDGAKIDADNEKVFCDAVGNCPEEKIAKLNIKKKDLDGKNMEVIFLERS